MSTLQPQEAPDMGHDADGIRELDNYLPRWWLFLFYLTIAFGVVYLLVYHVFRTAPLQEEAWRLEMTAARAEAERIAAQTPFVPLTEASSDPAVLALGKSIFEGKGTCMTCHGKSGEGGVGPNMCDPYKIHGHAFADTVRTITEGVADKGMSRWKGILTPKEIDAVASYVSTLVGSTPPNPKPPQGLDKDGKPPSA